MSTREWLGNAPAVAQVTDYLFAGTWETSDVITLTIGQKIVSTTAGSTTEATIVDSLVAIWNALSSTTHPEFAEITASRSGDNLRLTADTAGVPFTCTVATTETGGGAADDQTIDGGASSTGTDSTASQGPNDWGSAQNWSGGAVPVNSDDVDISRAVSIKYRLNQAAIALTSLTIPAAFTATIGLPKINGSGATAYTEYRDRFLKIGATTVKIGEGDGGGSPMINLDTDDTDNTTTVYRTGVSTDPGRPALLIKSNPGAASGMVLELLRGSVGVAYGAGETAKCNARIGYITSQEGDVRAFFGAGVTFDTVLSMSGGIATINSAVTTITKTAGTLTVNGVGGVTTLDNQGGECFYNSTGTLATAKCGPGAILSFEGDMSTKTVTNAVELSKGARLRDRAQVVSTLKWKPINCLATEVFPETGYNKTYTPS